MTADATESDVTASDSGVFEFVKGAIEGLEESADVRRVYGDPITVGGKTLVPVARVAYGFGGGFGRGTEAGSEREPADGEGGGGGGGVVAHPVGVLEVSDAETRFVRFADRKRVALALGVGLALGLLLGRRRTGR
jgi:uncharacterized spore protein YtfJ